jgi:hypothetical protein
MDQAQTEIDPIIAAITGAANKKAAAAEAAIKGYTDSYAQQLGGMDAGAPYSGAETQQAAVDASLRQALAGGGSDLASQLSARLAALQGSSGAGALAQEGGALASQGESAGNTRLASGSAALSALLGEHAAASSFSKKLPGLAKLSGLQGLRQSEGNAQQEISQGTLQAEGELPSIVQQIRSSGRRPGRCSPRTRTGRRAPTGAAAHRDLRGERGHLEVPGERVGAAGRGANQHRGATGGADGRQREPQLQGVARPARDLAEGRAGPVDDGAGEAQQRRLHADPAPRDADSGEPDRRRRDASQGRSATGDAHNGAERHSAVGRVQGGEDVRVRAGQGGHVLRVREGAGGRRRGGRRRSRDCGGPHDPRARPQYIGTPYVWGGESPKGFDCSGFAQYLYGKAGIRIPRTTYTQWQTGHSVPQGQLQPGDLVFFRGSDSKGGLPGHVGVYIGNGMMIDAPHTGASVRTERVDTFGGYMGARRYGKG